MLYPTLFFRDVGSHTTQPHALAVDNAGLCHLIVADVNIWQNNRLNLYWITGDPVAGKWKTAQLIDRRGFTTWSRLWCIASGNDVHVLWSWDNAFNNEHAGDSGIFYLKRSGDRFGQKVRVFAGQTTSFAAALDAASGQILLVASCDDGVYATSCSGGQWTRPTKLPFAPAFSPDIAVISRGAGAFVISVRSEPHDWVLRLKGGDPGQK